MLDTPLQAASLYVGLCLLLILVLAAVTVRYRRATRTSLGHGEDPRLMRAIRAHANAAEHIPAFLAALLVLAIAQAPTPIIHGFGAVFTLARAIHALALLSHGGPSLGRTVGVAVTWLCYIGLGAVCILYGFGLRPWP